MHNCVRCGKAVTSLEEINRGCSSCGSKIFIFNKESSSGSGNRGGEGAGAKAKEQPFTFGSDGRKPLESGEGAGAKAKEQGIPGSITGAGALQSPLQSSPGFAEGGDGLRPVPSGESEKKTGGWGDATFGMFPPSFRPDKTAGKKKQDADNGKVPESYFARVAFTSEDVENVKIVSEGVFLLDLNAMHGNPLVLKDEEGVYYVKLPFDQGRAVENFSSNIPAAGCADSAALGKAGKGGGKKEE